MDIARALGVVDERLLSPRRIRVLAEHVAPLMPPAVDVVDVGSGDGKLARAILDLRPDLRIEGVDVLVRQRTAIPTRRFDGKRLAFDDHSVGGVLLVDVAHHADDPYALLRECARVARDALVVKDHLADAAFARPTLRFMDRVGNTRHGVALPYAYWTRARWLQAFEELDLRLTAWQDRVPIYPWPLSLVVGRSLHFLARAEPRRRLTDRARTKVGHGADRS